EFCARLSMCLVRSSYFGDTFADERVRDDELRFPVVATLRDVKRVEKLLHVLAFDFLDVKAVRLHAFAGIFALGFLSGGIERDRVRIVDVDQVVEAPVRSQRARLRSDAFLHVAVTAQTDYVLVENFVFISVETCCGHCRRYRSANKVPDALAEAAMPAVT